MMAEGVVPVLLTGKGEPEGRRDEDPKSARQAAAKQPVGMIVQKR
jgi:hypothetical protein